MITLARSTVICQNGWMTPARKAIIELSLAGSLFYLNGGVKDYVANFLHATSGESPDFQLIHKARVALEGIHRVYIANLETYNREMGTYYFGYQFDEVMNTIGRKIRNREFTLERPWFPHLFREKI